MTGQAGARFAEDKHVTREMNGNGFDAHRAPTFNRRSHLRWEAEMETPRIARRSPAGGLGMGGENPLTEPNGSSPFVHMGCTKSMRRSLTYEWLLLNMYIALAYK